MPVRHVCSLGSVCQSSRMLQDTGLKRESYPFDWTFSSPISIERVLDDDFGQFLQRDLFVGIGPTQCTHLVYGERMFNHHNPKDNEEHYDYFTRCVSRFRALLATDASKLFVMTFPNLDNDAGSVASIKAQVTRLTVYLSSKTRNFRLFVVCHVPRCDALGASVADVSNVRFVTLRTTSVSDGVALTDPRENSTLQRILLDSYTFEVEKLYGHRASQTPVYSFPF